MIKFLDKLLSPKKEEKIINSEVIQKEFEAELHELMNKISINVESDSEIESLYEEIKNFNLDNLDLKEKIEKLKSLGLVNTPSVKIKEKELQEAIEEKQNLISEKKKEIEFLKSEKEMIKHYNLKYPSYKYIPKREFLNILEKYNLVMGEAFMYAKEIPDRAVNIISNFKDEIEDSEVGVKIVPDYSSSNYENKLEIKSVKHTKELRDWVANHNGYLNREGDRSEMLNRYDRQLNNYEFKLSKFKMVAPKDHFEVPKLNYEKLVRASWNLVKQFKDDEEVSICITKDGIITFDLTELNKGLGKIQRIKDPIALLCVNDFCRPIDGNYKNSFDYQHKFDGVIILDAWDEEANIPEIKNNLLN